MLVVRLFHRRKDMASQREWESVVWHFLSDHLRNTDSEEIKDWIYSLEPDTPAQEKRWDRAVRKVYLQLQKFAADEICEEGECAGYSDES
jgi:hypothetical protein